MKIQHLLESKQPDMNEIFSKFLPLAMNTIGLKKLPKIKLHREISDTEQPTFGRFLNNADEIHLAVKNRHPLDVLRTLAHELVHYKQKIENRLTPTSGQTGSPEENQAHELAGVVMRNFNKKYREYFQQPAITLEENMRINEIKLSLSGDTFPLKVDDELTSPGRTEYYDFETDRGVYKIYVSIGPFTTKKYGKLNYLKVFFMSKTKTKWDDKEHWVTDVTNINEPIKVLDKIIRTVVYLTKKIVFENKTIDVIDYRVSDNERMSRLITKFLEDNVEDLFPGWKQKDNYLYKEKSLLSKLKQYRDEMKFKKLSESKKKSLKMYESYSNFELDEARSPTPWKELISKEHALTPEELKYVSNALSVAISNLSITDPEYRETLDTDKIFSSLVKQSNSTEIIDYITKNLGKSALKARPKDRNIKSYSEENPLIFTANDIKPRVRTVHSRLSLYPWIANLKYCFPHKDIKKIAQSLSYLYETSKAINQSMSRDDFIINFFASDDSDKLIDTINNSKNFLLRYKNNQFTATPKQTRPKKSNGAASA